MAAAEGKPQNKTTFHAISTSDTIDVDTPTDSDIDDQQQVDTETAKQSQFQKLKDAQDDTFRTDSGDDDPSPSAQDPFLPSHPPNFNTPRIPKSIDIYNTSDLCSGHSITNASVHSLKIPTILTSNSNNINNTSDIYEH